MMRRLCSPSEVLVGSDDATSRALFFFRIHQSVQVNDHVLDVGVIDVLLADAAPGFEGLVIVGVDAEEYEPDDNRD